jgi:REP element-mobilizing transposase RayT
METENKLIGYMVTWTTFGTWLQGDERGFVKDGQILQPNENLKNLNLSAMKQKYVVLSPFQRNVVEIGIRQEAKRVNQNIHALTVCSNHIHLLVEMSAESIEQAVHRYKYSATAALRKQGITYEKIWSKGFDKRFCCNEKEINARIAYIQKHNQ